MDIKNDTPDLILGDAPAPEFSAHGVEWMLKMGYLESPGVQDALAANLYMISERVEEVALVADTETFKLLAYLRLAPTPVPRFHNKFISLLKSIFRIKTPEVEELTTEEIGGAAADKLQQALANFDIRVTFDKNIYKKSKELAEKLKKIRSGETL